MTDKQPATASSASAVFRPGNKALVTGGASGIGLALVQRCLSAGMKVLVVDRDPSPTATDPADGDDDKQRQKQGLLSSIIADVSDPSAWERAVGPAVEAHLGGEVHLLALNAGMGVRSGWDDVGSFRRTVETNLFGVVNGIHACLPTVQKTAAAAGRQTAVVITGSKQGITNPPGNPAYNASKAAVKSVAEHLSWDLRATPEVAVHLLVPGWTFTGMSGNRPGQEGEEKREKPAGAWWPEQVVQFLEKKMAEGVFYVLCPDNDVDEALDRKRILWSVGDLVQGRPPLSRWRDEFTEEFASATR